MSFLSWNVRGLGNLEKKTEVRNLISKNNVDWIGLTETKLREISKYDVACIWGNSYFDFSVCNASPTLSGGLLVIWCTNFFLKSKVHIGHRWIALEGTIKEANWQCCLCLVYGSCCPLERKNMFDELTALKQQIPCPMLICGDFNEILNPEDRRGQNRVTSGMKVFQNWVSSNLLLEVKLSGRLFTWSRGNSRSKLDRFFCDSD